MHPSFVALLMVSWSPDSNAVGWKRGGAYKTETKAQSRKMRECEKKCKKKIEKKVNKFKN